MPALKVCSRPGCPELVPTGRCSACERAADRCRGTAAERGYDARWARRRKRYIARHPLCVVQGPGCTGATELPDHWPRSRRDLVAAGVADPDADEHLRPSCQPCHRAETATHQPGGWAAR